MIAYAARYGHQQASEIGEMTRDRLKEFNDGLQFWIEKENESTKESP